MAHNNQCQQIRNDIEARAGRIEARADRFEARVAASTNFDPQTLDPLIQRHLDACASCREYAEMQHWSHQVLRAGEIAATPPLMSAVWASIHRASEQAWDSSLSRSFRFLLPYMIAVVALILLVGGLTSAPTATPVQAASTAYSVLNSPAVPAVAGVMTNIDTPAQSAAQILGDDRP
ncbi:MAG TPA: hypothetical protein VNE83_06235 [Terriglobales bacterium]|nr:hypothetical protein [Terriglobales bacterium]